MRDQSIFTNMKELHGTQGNFRLEIGCGVWHVYEQKHRAFYYIGLLTKWKKESNIHLYSRVAKLAEKAYDEED